jgi:anti-sigma28 factor (negative regulator of flagellin synthesis)
MAKPRKTGTKASIAMASIPKLTLEMPLDAARVKAIQRCIEKGTLKITISKVDLAAGRAGDPWLYD